MMMMIDDDSDNDDLDDSISMQITLKNKNIKKFIEKLDFLMPGVKRKK